MPRTLFDKIWDAMWSTAGGRHRVLYIDRHLVHEVTSPQAFEGLRLAGRKVRRPHATIAVADHNVPTDDRSHGIAEPESRLQVETLEQQRRRIRRPLFPRARHPPGHRAYHRPRSRACRLPGMTIVCGDSHTATHGALGRARLRHRHLRGRACARHPDAAAKARQEHAGPRRRHAARRLHGEGLDPRHHRQDRHRRRHRPCHRICRRGDPRAVDGRPHDGLQHVDRGRRPRRADRAGRDHLRLSQGPAVCAQGRGLGAGGRLLADAALRPRRALRQGSDPRRRRDRAASHLGHQPRGRAADHRPGARPGAERRRGRARRDASGRWTIWA